MIPLVNLTVHIGLQLITIEEYNTATNDKFWLGIVHLNVIKPFSSMEILHPIFTWN